MMDGISNQDTRTDFSQLLIYSRLDSYWWIRMS